MRITPIAAKGFASGLLWAVVPLVLYRGPIPANALWIVCCTAATGVVTALGLWPLRRRLSRCLVRWVCSIPTLLIAQAAFALLVTLPLEREGTWPERWFELTLAAYWADVMGLLGVLFVPATYVNITWVFREEKADHS